MLLGLISDSHGHVPNTRDGVRLLDERGVDRILHCGDIGSADIPALLCRPAHLVFGNVDRDEHELAEAIQQSGHACHGRFGSLELAGLRVALLHGDDQRLWEETVNSGTWDLVCFGHTHRRESRRVGTTQLVNPGAVFRARPHSVATVRLPQLAIEFLEF